MDWLSYWPNLVFVFVQMVAGGLACMALFGVDGDHDGDFDTDSPLFSILGSGKIPFSIALLTLMFSFGCIGLLLNAVADALFGHTVVALLFPITLAIGAFASIGITMGLASIIAKYAPTDAPTSRSPGEFVGCTGVAITSITHTIGQIKVTPENGGPAVILNGCLSQDRSPLIQRDTEVFLAAYDGNRNLYLVRTQQGE